MYCSTASYVYTRVMPFLYHETDCDHGVKHPLRQTVCGHGICDVTLHPHGKEHLTEVEALSCSSFKYC